jgi:hypothetical protein
MRTLTSTAVFLVVLAGMLVAFRNDCSAARGTQSKQPEASAHKATVHDVGYEKGYAEYLQGKPLLVSVTMDGCAPCKAMHDETVPAAFASGRLAGLVYCQVKVGTPDAVRLTRLAGPIGSVPQTHLIIRAGDVTLKWMKVGMMSLDELVQFAGSPAKTEKE